MRNLLMKIGGILYKVVGMSWIVSSRGEPCSPVPIYIVEEE